MGNLSQAKTYGGIGAILALIGGLVPSFGFVIQIIGFILVLLAVKYIAEIVRDNNIFKNYLFSVILAIAAVVAITAIMAMTIGSVGLNLTEMEDISSEEDAEEAFGGVAGELLTGCFAALAVGWILYIISAIFYRKSYNAIAEKTGVNLFSTTGLVYLIGAATVIIGIGLIILFVARILEIISYFSLPDNLQGQPVGTGGQMAAGGGAGMQQPNRRCPNCGRAIPENARVCPYCGKNFEQM